MLWGALAALLGAGCAPKTCTTSADCDSDQLCQFKIGSCTAKGECLGPPKPRSFLEVDYCGCNGSQVRSGPGPGYEEGYASGPTMGVDNDCTSADAEAPEAGVTDSGPALPD